MPINTFHTNSSHPVATSHIRQARDTFESRRQEEQMENRVGEYEQGQHVSTPQETILHVAPEQMEPTLIDSSGGDPTILNHERSGKELWKKAAFKIRHARMFVEAAQASWEPGKSQGIDAHTMQYDALSCQCQITAVDYGVERCKIINTLDNASLDGYLNRKRPSWSTVRWINISGLSWDVIKKIAVKYELHPLAIEDCLHIPQRTKLDTYMNHIYACLSLHTLSDKPVSITGNSINPTKGRSSMDSSRLYFPSAEDDSDQSKSQLLKRFMPHSHRDSKASMDSSDTPPTSTASTHPYNQRKTMMQHHYPVGSKYLRAHSVLRQQKVHVEMEQVSMFLTNENTLITLFQHSGQQIEAPILEKLGTKNTLLRSSSDPSLLLETILDHIVDAAQPIIEKYRNDIADLEAKVLVRPSTKYTRILHIISGELALLKRTLSPHIQLLNALRSHDDGTALLHFHPQFQALQDHDRHMSYAGGASFASGMFPYDPQTPVGQGGVPKSQLFAAAIEAAQKSTCSPSPGLSPTAPNSNTEDKRPSLKVNVDSPEVSRDEVPQIKKPRQSVHFNISPMTRRNSTTDSYASTVPRIVTISQLAKTYFGDSLDHTIAAIESIDIMMGICENTISLSFNILSNEQNESMKTLAIVSLFFLPLTFVTGYFGMNLKEFDALNNSVAYFWSIAAPLTAGIMVIFTWSYWVAGMGIVYNVAKVKSRGQ